MSALDSNSDTELPAKIPAKATPAPSAPATGHEAGNWNHLLKRMKTDAPKGALKQPRGKPQQHPSKAPSSTQPVEILHPNIEEGMTSLPQSASQSRPERRPWLSREQWIAKKDMLRQQEGAFDITKHGYWRTKNGLVFRHTDGREIAGATGVDDFE